MREGNSISENKEPQKRLQAWFRKNQRSLPWRHEGLREAYSVVVSEVMLQQTQVATVLKYWDNWMRKFPSFEALAKADESEVLKAWEGMGYYSRARNLKKLATAVVEKHKGKLPKTVEALLELPGIGRYSARSIASLAFGEPEACVDGNIVRVLSRLNGITKAYKNSAQAQHDFQPIAEAFLLKESPGEHNEAMMELGATVCTKASPKCEECPLAEFCYAKKNNCAEELPKLEKVKIETKAVKRIWIVESGKILLQTGNAATGVLEGLYELPTPETAGIKRLPTKPVLKRVRSITKYKITESIYAITKLDGILERVKDNKNLKWVELGKLDGIPLSGPHAAWIALLRGRKKPVVAKKRK